MNLLKIDNLQLHYGQQIIFDGLNLLIQRGDRLCLVGRNGVGKSTLLKTLEGSVEADSGGIWREPSCRVASLNQDLPEMDGKTVFDFVAGGLEQLGADLARYVQLSISVDPLSLHELGEIQQRIEATDGWSVQNQIEQVLTRLELDGNLRLCELSGGWRRRAALARALVCRPDVLLLDEPTNHLDIVAIEWLEKQLLDFDGAVVFVTHDRAFLRRVANRIGELDRGNLSVWQGDYQSFLEFRQQQLADEEKRNSEFDKKLAQEETWIRQGIKARRTRNEGRVRALKSLRQEYSERRARIGNAKMAIAQDTSSGKLVAEFKHVCFAWEEKTIIDDFSCLIVRGDKIGLIGPNGVGKSTFLKILMQQLQPTEGIVNIGSKLSIAYFDQLRDELDLNQSAVDNIAQGREFIEIDGKNKHIIGYLNDFLFTGERARTPLRALSGGERNRVLLAKLFSKPANCLVMDEPTNDLDAETLELLEDLLSQYQGTLLLVSHDREFLDNVVTSTIGFEGQGLLKQFVGGYQDWIRQGGVWASLTPSSGSAPKSDKPNVQSQAAAVTVKAKKNSVKKLSYKLQLELDSLPGEIERLEGLLTQIQAKTGASDFYSKDPEEMNKIAKELAETEAALQAAYSRWEELESLKEG